MDWKLDVSKVEEQRMKTHMKQKTFETMTLAEREEQILRAEESVWQYSNGEALVLFRLM